MGSVEKRWEEDRRFREREIKDIRSNGTNKGVITY